MVTLKEYEEKLIKRLKGAEVKSSALLIPEEDFYAPIEPIYDVYLRNGMVDSYLYVLSLIDISKKLDEYVSKKKVGDIYPFLTKTDKSIKLSFAVYAKEDIVEKIRFTEGDLEKALRNLTTKYPLIEKELQGIIYLETETSYLTASHLLTYDFPEDYFIAVPNQKYIMLIKKDKDIPVFEQKKAIRNAMLISEIGEDLFSNPFNLVLETKDVKKLRNMLTVKSP